MIVVLGSPAAHETDRGIEPGGLAGWIAVAAAAEGAPVQVVGRIGEDRAGDAVVLGLARRGVGHAAVLRDPSGATPEVRLPDDWQADEAPDALLSEEAPDAPQVTSPAGDRLPRPLTLDAADIALGLRYLTDFTVLVIADPLAPDAAGAALEAAAFAGARTVLVAGVDAAPIGADDVFEPPQRDLPAFAALVGQYVAALAAGEPSEQALTRAAGARGWTSAPR